MGNLFRILMKIPVFRPLVRFIIGALAIPVFRFFLRRVVRLHNLDAELEKDLERWFSCSLVLLISTAFMEPKLWGWLDDVFVELFNRETGAIDPVVAGLRILLAIGVIESMPDQELFSIVHPRWKLKFDRSQSFWTQLRAQTRPFFKGLVCLHLARSSPVFAILATLVPHGAGMICYALAITQYLIIGLVTSRDRALDLLSEFDRQVAIRRREIIDEFSLIDEPQRSEPAARESAAAARD